MLLFAVPNSFIPNCLYIPTVFVLNCANNPSAVVAIGVALCRASWRACRLLRSAIDLSIGPGLLAVATGFGIAGGTGFVGLTEISNGFDILLI